MTEPPDLEVADQLGHQLVRFARLISRAKAQFAATHPDGVESASYALLAHLVIDGPQRTTALAEAVHSDPSTVSRQTSQLVSHGWVERRADPADGRACLLVATDEGQRVFHHNRCERTKHLAGLLSGWPAADRRTLVTLLDRLNTDFEHYKAPLVTTAGSVPNEGETR